MENAVALLALGFLASKVFELIKRVKAKDTNGALSILAIFVAGVVAVAVAAHAMVMATVVIPGTTVALGKLDFGSQLFLGLTLSSFVGKLFDFQKAVDTSDSAVQPKLVGPVAPNNQP